MLEENIVTELELDEEQLQAITGGCAQCDPLSPTEIVF
jgi:bacteriocin-like protein